MEKEHSKRPTIDQQDEHPDVKRKKIKRPYGLEDLIGDSQVYNTVQDCVGHFQDETGLSIHPQSSAYLFERLNKEYKDPHKVKTTLKLFLEFTKSMVEFSRNIKWVERCGVSEEDRMLFLRSVIFCDHEFAAEILVNSEDARVGDFIVRSCTSYTERGGQVVPNHFLALSYIKAKQCRGFACERISVESEDAKSLLFLFKIELLRIVLADGTLIDAHNIVRHIKYEHMKYLVK